MKPKFLLVFLEVFRERVLSPLRLVIQVRKVTFESGATVSQAECEIFGTRTLTI
jgi:hypothetical protein